MSRNAFANDRGVLTLPFFLIFASGNTLKNIEKECCAKIMIRGKGSVKEGKVGRKDGQMLPGEDEPLHALVTANTMENVKKAVEQVRSARVERAFRLLTLAEPLTSDKRVSRFGTF